MPWPVSTATQLSSACRAMGDDNAWTFARNMTHGLQRRLLVPDLADDNGPSERTDLLGR